MDDNVYNQHLTEVNQIQGVIATEDIHNAQGQLLLPKGSSIDQKATDKMLKFKLLKPLENSIAIEEQLNADSLYSAIETYFLSDDSLREIWLAHNQPDLLAKCCNEINQYSILMQKLTVLSLQYPRQFQLATFCAWFAVHIYAAYDKEEIFLFDAFIAGFTHDIGMLHLNPDFIHGERTLSAEEWRQLQSHPIISREILKNVSGMRETAYRAVADHHESIDATGYPARKISKQISEIGLMLHLLNSTYAIYHKHFKPSARNLHDVIPIIQMNQHFRHSENANNLLVLMKSIPPTVACFTPSEHIDALIQHVIDKDAHVVKFLECTSCLNKDIGYRHGEKRLLGLQNILLHIHVSLTRSGLVNEAYMRWLKQVKDEKLEYAYREIEDVNLMLIEIIHHTEKFKVSLNLYLDDCKDIEQLKILSDVYAGLERIPTPKIDANINNAYS